MGATCVLPACFLRASFYTATAGAGLTSTYKLNWTETHTIWSTFLGSMQEAHMGGTCVLPSVASLTGRSVCLYWAFRQDWKGYILELCFLAGSRQLCSLTLSWPSFSPQQGF